MYLLSTEALDCGETDNNWYDVGQFLDYDCSVRFRRPNYDTNIDAPSIMLDWYDDDGDDVSTGNPPDDDETSDPIITAR